MEFKGMNAETGLRMCILLVVYPLPSRAALKKPLMAAIFIIKSWEETCPASAHNQQKTSSKSKKQSETKWLNKQTQT
jgi:hypothetical protein